MKYSKKMLEKIMKKNGGWLDLRGTQITSLPDNLTVGGSLYLSGTQIKNPRTYKRLRNGDYVERRYLYADDILTHIKEKKVKKGYTYFVGRIPNHNVICDGVNYAHCRSFKEGVLDLEFKKAKERGAEQYKNLKLDSVVKFDEARTMYRIITGACQAGTQQFIDNMKEKKEQYTISEIIQLTKGAYGGTVFEEFFKNRE